MTYRLKPCILSLCLKPKLKPAGNANHIHMEWEPLLIKFKLVHLLQGLSLPLLALLLLSNRKEKLNFSDGDWVTGQPKRLCATCASALLAGI